MTTPAGSYVWHWPEDADTVIQAAADQATAGIPAALAAAHVMQRIGPFTINFDDADIATGVALFTPNVGDEIWAVRPQVVTRWDSTNAKLAIGTWLDAGDHLFVDGEDFIGALKLNGANAGTFTGTDVLIPTNSISDEGANAWNWNYSGSTGPSPAFTVLLANPICAKVDVTGGGAPTQGQADIYFLVIPA